MSFKLFNILSGGYEAQEIILCFILKLRTNFLEHRRISKGLSIALFVLIARRDRYCHHTCPSDFPILFSNVYRCPQIRWNRKTMTSGMSLMNG